ncbi:MAG: septation protein SepH, partial [Actinomycetota bacterium]
MAKLYLVGFTTDLKSLIFAARKGAKSGSYIVSIDSRLKRTLEEVVRLDSQPKPAKSGAKSLPEGQILPSLDGARPSGLSPREIQMLLREGKTLEQVAKLAETDVSWVERFIQPIIAERAGVIVLVKSAKISKSRLGLSDKDVGTAVSWNLESKRVHMSSEEIDDAWTAVRREGRPWQVSFQYKSRGQRKVARFTYDQETRTVEPMNAVALDIGWLVGSKKSSPPAPSRPAAKPKPRPKTKTKPKPRPKT